MNVLRHRLGRLVGSVAQDKKQERLFDFERRILNAEALQLTHETACSSG